MVVLPRSTQPASRTRAAGGASAACGGASPLARVPIAAAVRRTLALSLALSATAQAAEEVRVWHTLDTAMSERLAQHAADYNALQQEFRVHLEPLRAAGGKHLVRLPLPLNTARPVLYYNRDAFRRARLDPPKTWYDMAPVLGALAEAGFACARQFRRHVEPRGDGALELAPRLVGEGGALQLRRARRRGRGALRRRRMRGAQRLRGRGARACAAGSGARGVGRAPVGRDYE